MSHAGTAVGVAMLALGPLMIPKGESGRRTYQCMDLQAFSFSVNCIEYPFWGGQGVSIKTKLYMPPHELASIQLSIP